MTELKDYRGLWALVTGAGDGIGRALTLAFARQGINVVASDIRSDAAASVAQEAEALGVQANADTAGVADRASMIQSAERLAAQSIVPSILWANAGVGVAANTTDASPRTVEWVLSVNIFGVVWTAQAFVPRMLERFGGERRMAGSVGDPWRKTPGPEVVVDPVLRTIAKGGGRCVVDAIGEARPLFEAKTEALRAAFDA